MSTAADTATSEQLLATILKSLTDDKAEDIVQIDLRGKTEIGDYMVICTGRSTRQGYGRLGPDRHGRCDCPCVPS